MPDPSKSKRLYGACAALLCLTTLAACGIRHTETQEFWVEEVITSLNFPTAITWLPNDSLLVMERMGGMKLFQPGQKVGKAVSGLPEALQTGPADGLRGLALDVNFHTNRQIFILLTEGTRRARYAAVYRATLNGANLENVTRIFRTHDELPSPEFSSVPTHMMRLPDGTLLIATAAPEAHEQAQNMRSHLGKVLRINPDGSAPLDNPFIGVSETLPEIWALGLRGVLDFYRDSEGLIWIIDPGPRGGDELNILKRGANYGWPNVGWGFSYSNSGGQSPKQTQDGITDPVFIWTPAITPSGVARYEANAFPKWRGDLFVSALTEKGLERLRFNDKFQILERQILLTGLHERLREVKIGPDGFIYALTDNSNGRLLRLRPGQPDQAEMKNIARTPDAISAGYDQYNGTAVIYGAPEEGREIFLNRCASCHIVGSDLVAGNVGPDLSTIVGRNIASLPAYSYSAEMRARGKWSRSTIWTPELINTFLIAPDVFVSGTTMSTPGIQDPIIRGKIVSYLASQSKPAP